MAEKLTEVELVGVETHHSKPRNLGPALSTILQEEEIETHYGTLNVSVQGDKNRPAILTYHDIGLNSSTCFQGFFNFADMQIILRNFCVYHVTAPGQQEGSLPLPHGAGNQGDADTVLGYQYPTMDQLSDMLISVIQHYQLKQIIGFGVGAGANVLARFATKNPDLVEGLVLINCSVSKPGWIEWGYQKMNAWHLQGGNVSLQVEDYLLWHWFGYKTMETNHDLIHVYSNQIKSLNPTNLAHFIGSYIKRTDVGIVRESNPRKRDTACMIRCPVLLCAGRNSPHLNDTINTNTRIDPSLCQFMQFECGGMVLEEAPSKLAEAFRLFVQGVGHVPTLTQAKLDLLKKQAGLEHEKPREPSALEAAQNDVVC